MVSYKLYLEGRSHYLHTTDGKSQAEQLGNTTQTTGKSYQYPE